jgi:hypothetical protein
MLDLAYELEHDYLNEQRFVLFKVRNVLAYSNSQLSLILLFHQPLNILGRLVDLDKPLVSLTTIPNGKRLHFIFNLLRLR